MTAKPKNWIDFRKLRQASGKTQRQVACVLDVAPNTVGYWDRGRQPSTQHLPDLAVLFDMTIEELYGLPRP
ncbi:helix-turn-helix transcriptional regulator [Streptosporangium canum]|uniref:helix-turn-helix transcriptional regulator n=1 Tax=Streptosporangium canum TaxID=324952 RepID=UPI0033BB4291